MLPKLGDAAKHEGKPVDEEYDSSDDEDELAGVVSPPCTPTALHCPGCKPLQDATAARDARLGLWVL